MYKLVDYKTHLVSVELRLVLILINIYTCRRKQNTMNALNCRTLV